MLRTVGCKFGVQAGGHTPFEGSSTLPDGITIDLRNMKELTISSDKKMVSLGPGNKWRDVYPTLDAAAIRIVGGRDPAVGVGGLMVGGGISFFSGRYGMAVDNIIAYEVVFADGTIRKVTQSSYPDVYKALRGGGNNFGIVTRFDVNAYPATDMWGGQLRWAAAGQQLPRLIQATVDFNERHSEDPDASIILSYIWVASAGMWLINGIPIHANPEPYPASLKNFTDVTIGLVQSTLRTAPLTNFTEELGATTTTQRATFMTFTYKNDYQLSLDIAKLYEELVEEIKGVPGIFPATSFQTLSKQTISQFSKNGGNALGVKVEDGPLIILNTGIRWLNKEDDAVVLAMAKTYIARATAMAKERGLWHPYVYLNYADISQDVFSGYGAASKAQLVATHRKWDPSNVFTRLQPGNFKIE